MSILVHNSKIQLGLAFESQGNLFIHRFLPAYSRHCNGDLPFSSPSQYAWLISRYRIYWVIPDTFWKAFNSNLYLLLNKLIVTTSDLSDKFFNLFEGLRFRKIDAFDESLFDWWANSSKTYSCIAIMVRKSTTVASFPPLKLT